MKQETKYQVGDKVIMADFDTCYKSANVLPTNERFQNHYKYMQSKEPLVIDHIWYPGELIFDEEDAPLTMKGRPTTEVYYNIPTPRSKLYLFKEDMLLPYIEDSESVSNESTI